MGLSWKYHATSSLSFILNPWERERERERETKPFSFPLQDTSERKSWCIGWTKKIPSFFVLQSRMRNWGWLEPFLLARNREDEGRKYRKHFWFLNLLASNWERVRERVKPFPLTTSTQERELRVRKRSWLLGVQTNYIEGETLEHLPLRNRGRRKGNSLQIPAFVVRKQDVKPDKFPSFPLYLSSIMS